MLPRAVTYANLVAAEPSSLRLRKTALTNSVYVLFFRAIPWQK